MRSSRYCLSLFLLLALPLTAAAQNTFTVTTASKTSENPNFGQGHPDGYYIDGVEAKTLTLMRGVTYTFQMQDVPTFHPFYISTSEVGGGAGMYNEGVTGNNATGDMVLTFTPTAATPDLLFYQCQFHQFMGWRINVIDAPDFVASLSGANEVPANGSSATGEVFGQLEGDSLIVSGSFSGLSTDVATSVRGGAHIHLAPAGMNGGIVIELNATFDGDLTSGTFDPDSNRFELTAEQKTALENRELYVNVHSSMIRSGEIRGQLLPGEATTFRAALTGRAQGTANASTGQGTVLGELQGNELTVSGAFSQLTSDVNTTIRGGAHLHAAGLGENGGIAFELDLDLGDDNRSGVFAAANNTFTLTDEQVQTLMDGGYYVNVHTSAFGGGEVRGQLLPDPQRAFEATLQGANEAPNRVETSASGGVIAVLDEEAMTLTVSGSFSSTESDVNTAIRGGAHLHGAPAGEGGGIVFELTPTLGDDNRSGTFVAADNRFDLTAEQVQTLLDGGFYVNIHTADNGGGELRGQLLASTNVAPGAATITAPEDGATLVIEGDASSAFTVTWDPASDPNSNQVYYVWQLSATEDFSDQVLIDTVLTEAQFESDFGAVASLLTGTGIGLGQSTTLYHRVLSGDGSMLTASDTLSVQLTRGAITAVDGADLPQAFVLHGNFPNPFNPQTHITFDLPHPAEVQVEVYDLLGRRVLSLPQKTFSAGAGHTFLIDAATLPSGVYLYRVVANTGPQPSIRTGHMTLVK